MSDPRAEAIARVREVLDEGFPKSELSLPDVEELLAEYDSSIDAAAFGIRDAYFEAAETVESFIEARDETLKVDHVLREAAAVIRRTADKDLGAVKQAEERRRSK